MDAAGAQAPGLGWAGLNSPVVGPSRAGAQSTHEYLVSQQLAWPQPCRDAGLSVSLSLSLSLLLSLLLSLSLSLSLTHSPLLSRSHELGRVLHSPFWFSTTLQVSCYRENKPRVCTLSLGASQMLF